MENQKNDMSVNECFETGSNQITEKVINYLNWKYKPISIIVYGSYADKTNDACSDFDALVVSSDCQNYKHDASLVDGVRLDVHIYNKNHLQNNINEFIHVANGIVVYDTDQLGEKLLNQIKLIKKNISLKSKDEILSDVEWCKKMCVRVRRMDAEGLFRLHWVLVDSLEIFCSASKKIYEGPKRSLAFMRESHPEGYTRYLKALKNNDFDSLDDWVRYLDDLVRKM